MAALVEGQQYGLSAQDKINCTKSLVFVKLTDSALRSIEEYVKNKADTISRPTIQFSNSTGVISLPHHGSSQNYGFTLSNVEVDGPHGSFECLRQAGHRSLESLGCMQLKMHIHATEDSYENTRVKMAAVEKEQKKSCTKVIKPAGAHLGRKVKVKRPGLVVSPIKSSPPTASMINKIPVKPLHSTPPAAAAVCPSVPAKKPEPPRPKATPKNPELVRQPIRDRIIHILAVRPYKRPELLVRLNSDGLREKDRNKLSSILPQLSVLKGNIYYLAKGCWKEVQENWKFCTQEELEIIRKRKQQNESTPDKIEHEAPAPIPQTNSSPLQKRILNEVETNGHPRNKKQRISHYKGDQQQRNGYGYPPPEVVTTTLSKKTSYSPGPPSLNGALEENSSQKSPSGNSSEGYSHRNSSSDALSSSSHQRTREEGIRSHPGYPAPVEKPPPKPRPPVQRPMRPEAAAAHPKSYVNSDMGKTQTLSHPRSVDSKPQVSPDSNTQYQAKEDACSKTETNGYVNSKSIKSNYTSNHSNQSSYVNRSKVTSTTNGSCSNSPHSSSDSRDSMDYNDTNLQVPPPTDSPSQCDSPEYEKEYCRIESSEQRARYKANFNAEYEEYLCLHQKIMNISRKFASMERHLHTCQEGSEEFVKIKGKIIKEYRAHQQDPNYIDALKKFNYLHTKLAYIKRLVTEYDTAQCAKS